jgi:hypothetical protein
MTRHDEPNEYGFAGEPGLPEPPPPGERDETDAAEDEAVPGDDLPRELSEALSDLRGEEPEHPGAADPEAERR